jgi:hypothetical protein
MTRDGQDILTPAEALAYLCEDSGRVPCSRYGRNSEECAPVAVALCEIIAEANYEDITRDALDHAMGLVVNDHDDPMELIRSHGDEEQRATIDDDVWWDYAPRSSLISNSDDIIDSRDVIERIAELEAQRDEGDDDYGEAEELSALEALAEEAGSYAPDWEYGEALIRYSYFEDYARELADDIGAIDADASWPACFIDWGAAADALKMDYTSVDFDGVEYWVRS